MLYIPQQREQMKYSIMKLSIAIKAAGEEDRIGWGRRFDTKFIICL